MNVFGCKLLFCSSWVRCHLKLYASSIWRQHCCVLGSMILCICVIQWSSNSRGEQLALTFETETQWFAPVHEVSARKFVPRQLFFKLPKDWWRPCNKQCSKVQLFIFWKLTRTDKIWPRIGCHLYRSQKALDVFPKGGSVPQIGQCWQQGCLWKGYFSVYHTNWTTKLEMEFMSLPWLRDFRWWIENKKMLCSSMLVRVLLNRPLRQRVPIKCAALQWKLCTW